MLTYLDLLRAAVIETASIQASLAENDPAAWRALAATTGFSITVDGIRRDVFPDFSGCANMAAVASRLQAAVNAAFTDHPVTVVYNEPYHRFIFTSSGRARFDEATIPGKLNEKSLLVAAGSADYRLWKALGNTRSFMITVET